MQMPPPPSAAAPSPPSPPAPPAPPCTNPIPSLCPVVNATYYSYYHKTRYEDACTFVAGNPGVSFVPAPLGQTSNVKPIFAPGESHFQTPFSKNANIAMLSGFCNSICAARDTGRDFDLSLHFRNRLQSTQGFRFQNSEHALSNTQDCTRSLRALCAPLTFYVFATADALI